MSITCGWPPWALMNSILRTPERATLSPICSQSAIKVSAGSVSVPGKSICSFDLPTGMVGSSRTGRSGSAAGDGGRCHGFGDQRVGGHRQMGSVLLDGTDRQHRDGPFGVEGVEIDGRQVLPAARGGHLASPDR